MLLSTERIAEIQRRTDEYSPGTIAAASAIALAYWAEGASLRVDGLDVTAATLFDEILAWVDKSAEHTRWAVETPQNGWAITVPAEVSLDDARLALDDLAEFPNRPVGTIGPDSTALRLETLARWNDTDAPRERPTIVEMFREQARLRPDATAVVDGDRSLSYRELLDRSNQLARHLIDRGLTAEQVVGISLGRSAEMVVGLLGVLQAGCAFVPLDPQWPAARRAVVIADARAVLQLNDSGERPEGEPDAVPVDLGEWRFGHYPTELVDIAIPGPALAYVMFTSGSTGRPKGAMIRHEAISERLLWQVHEILKFGIDDASLFKAPLSFDISINEIFLPLVSGGRVVIVPSGGERDPHHLLHTIAENRVTFVYLVSSMLDVLLEIAKGGDRLDSLRHVWCGGEVLTPELYERFRTQLDIPMYHGYGPAETTIGVSHVIYRGEAERLSTSIGKANPNTELYVLDEELRPVPTGVGGELYVGGFLLGRGYINAPALTATRFVANPFKNDGSRLYRTGDLARFHPDGSLDFLGRADNQVKIRGMRLETEDVEVSLAEHPRVRHTCVVAKKNSAGGTYLVGYVVPATGSEDLRADEIKTWAAEHMVEYMVPAHIVVLPEFPLTANGKLDRRALPEPTVETHELTPPATDDERAVCAAVASVLRLPRVGADQNFFELGGDSILAISLLSTLRDAGLFVTATQIFKHMTPRDLAAVASREDASVDHDDVATGPITGSPITRWLGETTDAIDGFVQSVVVSTPDGLTPEALGEMLDALARRHDMLRAKLIRGTAWGFEVPQHETQHGTVPWSKSDEPLEDCVASASAGLDPDAGVMLTAVWRRAARQLVLVAHHVIIDGVSWRVLLDDLALAWRQLDTGEPINLPAVGTSFRRWTQLLELAAGNGFAADLEYFRRPLPDIDQPLGRRAVTESDTVATERTRVVTVDPATTAALLTEVPAKFHGRVNDVLLTGLTVALARWRRDQGQAQTFAHVELEGHGREGRHVAAAVGIEPELSRTVGWFTTLCPVTVDPGTADWTNPARLSAALKSVKEDLARLPRNGLSYGVLNHLTDEEIGQPQPQVLFNYLGRFEGGEGGEWRMTGTTEQLGEKRDPAMPLPRALEFNAIAEPGATGELELATVISWPDGVFTDDDITTIGDHFRATLEALATLDHGGHSPSDFDLVPLTQADVDALDGPALRDILPLSPLQEGLYFHSIFDDDSAHSYVEQQLLTLQGNVDAERLRAAATRLLAIYPNLAARFVGLADGRVVSVLDGGLAPAFTTLDRPGITDDEIRAYADRDRRAGFDLSTGPLMRFTLIRTGPTRSVLVQTVHHIIADGWSVPPMLRALLAEYTAPGTAYTRGGYADYVRWLAGRDADEGDWVWREQLADLPGPSLVAPDHTPSATFAETTVPMGELPPGVPVSAAVHSAWAVTLGGILGTDDVVFGSTVSGRDAPVPGIEDMVGLFINTIPVRVRWTGKTTARDLIDSVTEHQTAVLEHQHVSLTRIGRQANTSGALFDTLVVFDVATDTAELRDAGGDITVTEIVNDGAPHYPLTLVVEGRERFNLIYDGTVLREATARSILRTFVDTLTTLLAEPEQPVATPTLAARTPAPVEPKTLAQLYDAAAERDPAATALTLCRLDGGTRSLTYEELSAAKNRLASALHTLGIGPGKRVAIALPRSPEQVIALIAVATAGGAYVPLDLAYPDERLEYVLGDVAPEVVLVERDQRERFERLLANAGVSARVFVEGDEIDADGPVPAPMDWTNPAYVIYTSGSTGKPKGVVVSHANVVSLLANTKQDMEFGPHDVWTQFHSYSFDFAVWELWGALCHGGRLIIPDHGLTRSPVDFHRLVCERGVTVLNQTPSAFYQFAEADRQADRSPNSLRRIIFGGEALDLGRLRGWVERHGTGSPELVNMYGITETTVHVTHRVLGDDDFAESDVSPIGGPVPGLVTYLLDDQLRPVAPGQIGTIYVAGDQVALGYLGKPSLTASRFVANPFSGNDSRMYYTGDLARRTLDGELEFAGRADDQVQLKGFRIELGEVETALREVDGVVDAAVTVADTDDHLVAHVVGHAPVDLTARLGATLPAHMVPQRVITVDALPLTINGKLDRTALTAGAARAEKPREATDSALTTLVEIFADVLPESTVDGDTDFFMAGGDSIIAITVVNRARALGVPIAPRDVFLRKTPRALAAHCGVQPVAQPEPVADGPVAPTPIMLRQREIGGPLAGFAQARTLTAPDGTGFADAERAAAEVVAAHAALRLRLHIDNGIWSLRTDPDREVTVDRADSPAVADELAARLDPEAGSTIAFAWIESSRTLVIVAHHLAVDAISWLVLLDDLATAMRGETLAAPTTPYAAYADALVIQAQSGVDSLATWIDTLAAPPLLPEVTSRREITVELAPEITDRVARMAPAALGIGLTELLLGALRTALTEIHPDDLAIELERHGRVPVLEHHDYARTVGWFTAIAPLRLTAHTDPIAAAREITDRQPDERAHLAYGQLRYLNPQTANLLGERPQVLFNYLGRGTEDDTLHLDAGDQPSPYAVEVNTWLDGTTGALHASFHLADGVPDELTEHWTRALERIADGAETAERTAPVSPLQRGLYFQAELAGSAGHYVAQSWFTFDRRLDTDALADAMAHVIARHPVVGAGFSTDDTGAPVQILRPGIRVPVHTVDLRGEPDGTLEALRTEDRDTGFDASAPPLVRLTVVRLDDKHDGLLLSYHLLLWDGWSRAVVLRDLFDAYRTIVDGGVLDSTPATPSFDAYTRALAAKDSVAAEQFWAANLADLPGPTLLAGEAPKLSDALPSKITHSLSVEESERIRQAARRHGVTLNSVLTGAFGLLLGSETGRADAVFGITVSGREATDIGDTTGDLSGIVGVLLNTVPTRTKARPDDTVERYLAGVQADRVAAMEHDHLGLGEIQRASGHDQLFDTLFVLQNFLDEEEFAAMNSAHGITDVDAEDSTHYPFTWVVTPGDRLAIKLEYRDEITDAATARRMLDDYLRLLDALSTSDGLVGALPSTGPAPAISERTDITTDTVVDRFDRAADANPDRIALVAHGDTMTFAHLRDRTREVAGVLAAQGIGPGSTVAIAVPRSLDSIVALFAILRCGAAYVPLELDHPDERIAAIVADARPDLILTVSAVVPRIVGAELLELDRPLPAAEPVVTFTPEDPNRLRHAAYTIYTSGSTGKPKGVVTEYAGLTNMLINHQRRIFEPVLAEHGHRTFRIAHTVSFAFDMSWEELLWLADGHEVHICDEELRRDATGLVAYCLEHRIDVINVTPTYAQQLVAEGLLDDAERRPPLILLGGEAVTPTLWQRLADTDGVVGYNLYGPTEYTINTLGVGTFDCADPVVGVAIDNTDVYVLDPWLRPVPDGVPGELYVSGIGIARGYLGQAALTAERFVACPYVPGERMYRTGDLVQRRPDGNLMYLGRTDKQVKIRGHRVELGEVEAAFAAHPAVRFVAAVAQSDPQVDGAYRLAAYLVLDDTDLAVVAAEVGAGLPDYLRPTHYARVDAIPLTVNGKADTTALPEAKPLGALTGGRRAPSTETETIVCELFAEALDLDDDEVGVDSDFVSLGGHSMLAVRLIGLLRREFGPVITIRDLLSLGTPEAIASHLDD
ncbi:non-ribosomal peptide synthase protein (TIGR01720 family)/amino acid adenylation domain-containing protein [Herbihabitans rhizosphaerae]|uniref:Non-ribosomal peptide synthase protein (TIGR01720 family)/amino acid adenylation domain-containing protein n=1 Tax=Herbihabitans rhizosphaerae TaxID=1872711 RepID=A0A4Q7L4I9_9PSEU|nr:non-ribosomal peptide synthetase [Herbihabitans rhizosphaerae]RZS43122.1 non-ribosomal peptide synthase protein (TIGR01720 family)/amino acid adenylation domain-containing protein [Herbihabitans rhizosphaerae]